MMRFNDDNYPQHPKRSSQSDELTDTIAEEHPRHFVAVAEEQIKAMHHHNDGSAVELHQIGSREFIQQSITSSLEGKLGGSDTEWQPQNQNENNLAAAKIEYEKKSSQQPQHDLLGKGQSKLYGAQQSVTGAAISHRQETAMVGCNCGAEWTVTGQSTKKDDLNPAAVKVERYGSAGSGSAGYNVSSGSGSGPGEYKAGGGQKSEYRG